MIDWPLISVIMVKYGHLLQAVISKWFWAKTHGFHHWIGPGEQYNLRIKKLNKKSRRDAPYKIIINWPFSWWIIAIFCKLLFLNGFEHRRADSTIADQSSNQSFNQSIRYQSICHLINRSGEYLYLECMQWNKVYRSQGIISKREKYQSISQTIQSVA